MNPIYEKIESELERARKKYPDNEWPWNGYLTLFEMTALVATEAGEALQAANKFYYNKSGSIDDIKSELIQVMSTAMRVYQEIDKL